ncbi:MAG: molybdopterin-binding protein, partial [Nitrospira sp. LK265]|nr:molybdopterin-binding protein [Nitrospira sp. LK265]
MKHERAMERRNFLKDTLGAASLVALSGCDNLTQSGWFPAILSKAERLTEAAQRAVTPKDAFTKEYGEADISKIFPANGNTDPGTEQYAAHVAQNFSEWTLEVVGLVQTPRSWSLAELKEPPSRMQITRHDCVEGWSAIGKWTGIPVGDLMRQVEPLPHARYAVFHCADVDDEEIAYYESMAVADCYHPQTILAYELNDAPLDIPHGAPLRLRFER